MNGLTLPAILLHGVFFTAAASVVLWFFRRQSAARLSAGLRLIIAATLTLAAVEMVSLRPAAVSAEAPAAPGPAVSDELPLPQVPLTAGPESVSPLSLEPAFFPAPQFTGVTEKPERVPPSRREWIMPPWTASVLGSLWLTGAALVLLRWIVAVVLRQRWVRHAAKGADASWYALLAAIPGGRKITRVLHHPNALIPCTWGVFRPVIVLPDNPEEWPPAQRRMVLVHECTHIARRDPLWHTASHLFLALQWFNPLAWLLLRNLRMADERAADDVVLTFESDAPAYADLLLCCSRRWMVSRPIAAVASFMARPSTVSRRVEAILRPLTDRRPAGFLLPVSGAVVCAALALLVSTVAPRLVASEEPPALKPAFVQEEEPGDIWFSRDRVTASPVLDWQRNPPGKFGEDSFDGSFIQRDTEIHFDPREITPRLYAKTGAIDTGDGTGSKDTKEPVPVPPPAPKSSVSDVSGGIRDLKVTSKPADGTDSRNPLSAEEVYAALDRVMIPAAKFTDMPAADVLRELSQTSGVGITWLRDTGDKNVTVEWPRSNLRTALEAVCKAADTRYSVNVWHKNGGGSHAKVSIRNDVYFNVQTYLVPEALAAARDKPGELTAALKKAGILFPEGAFASTDVKSQRLVVKNTPDQLRRVAIFLETGNPDAPWPWHPVKIGNVDYVSTKDIEGFYACSNMENGMGWRPFNTPQDTRKFANSRFHLTLRKSDSFVSVNNMRFVLTHPLVERDSKWWISRNDVAGLLDPVLRASGSGLSFQLRTVVIDAGHGGRDSGAAVNALRESALNLDVALHLQKMLTDDGLNVVMTREDDSSRSRQERAAIASVEPNAVLVSIHFNCVRNKRGIETLLLRQWQNPAIHPDAAALGIAVHRACLPTVKSDGGLQAAGQTLMAGVKIPGILIEAGNLMDAEDRARIENPDWRRQLAASIAAGIRACKSAPSPLPK